MTAIYDTIGIDYANLRKPDPRIATQIHRALGSAQTVLNVGAGTGSYEPTDSCVTAVEPSVEMLRQRPDGQRPGGSSECRRSAVRGRQFRRGDGSAHRPSLDR